MYIARALAELRFRLFRAYLPMMAHAMMIARNSEMMSGRNRAAKRADAIAKEIDAQAPDIARLFDDGVFCEMCAALLDAPSWSVTIEKDWRSWRSTGPIYVTVGKARFRSEDTSYDDNCSEVERLKAFLEEVSPLEEMVSGEVPEAGLAP